MNRSINEYLKFLISGDGGTTSFEEYLIQRLWKRGKRQ